MYARIGTACVLLLLSLSLQAQPQIIDTYAGGGPNNVLALSANIGTNNGMAVDASGNYYFTGSNRIFKVDPAGNLTVVAGNGASNFSGDGGGRPPTLVLALGALPLTKAGTSTSPMAATTASARLRPPPA